MLVPGWVDRTLTGAECRSSRLSAYICIRILDRKYQQIKHIFYCKVAVSQDLYNCFPSYPPRALIKNLNKFCLYVCTLKEKIEVSAIYDIHSTPSTNIHEKCQCLPIVSNSVCSFIFAETLNSTPGCGTQRGGGFDFDAIISQGWALLSFPFGTLRSFPF